MEHVRLRRLLNEPIASPRWPTDVRLMTFTPDHAAAVHALLENSYTDGGGSVAAFSQWWGNLSADGEYDPALCFTAFSSGHLIGVAQCWTSGYVKDLAVHASWRRRGVATALLLHAFGAFRERGAERVDLKVKANNSGAAALYRLLGMISV